MPDFPRQKPRRLWISMSYRLYRLANKILGKSVVLKVLLNTHWLVERYSWESIVALYGDSAFNSTNLQTLMQKWIKPGSQIIDIGCGNGRLSAEAAKYGKVVGIDRHDGFRSAVGVEFRMGDAMDIQEKFDVAILSHIIEHLEDPGSLLRSITADLLIIEVPNFLADGRNVFRERLHLPCYSDDDHLREYTVGALAEQLSTNGWRPREWIINSAISVVVTRR